MDRGRETSKSATPRELDRGSGGGVGQSCLQARVRTRACSGKADQLAGVAADSPTLQAGQSIISAETAKLVNADLCETGSSPAFRGLALARIACPVPSL